MNPATLKRIVENHIATLEGNAFQDFCDRLCIKLYPGDYTPVRAGGRKGDMKNDGYCPKARIFFAAHATRGEEIAKTCNLYSEAMNALNVHDHAKRLSQLRLKRSTVFLALDKEEEFEKDCTVAYELDPSSVEAVFKYSGIRDKRGDRDGAIDLVNGLVDKGLRPAVDMRLAQLLWERGNPDDRARARELLLGRLDDLRQESPEVCLEYLLLLSEVELGIHGAEASLLLLDKVAEELLGSELALFLKAELLRQVGKLEEASEMTRELQALVTEASRPDTVRRTATLLQSLGLHKEALCLWKRIVEFDYIGILERLSQRPGGVDMIKGLLGSIDRIFGVDVINAQRARNVIVGWLKSGGTRVIIP